MMKLDVKFIGTLILACIAGVVSFYITRGLNTKTKYSNHGSMRKWLAFTDEQDDAIRQSDPDFNTEAAELSLAFIAERQQLARILDAPASSDMQVTAQVERVIEANHALIKRVVAHILAVREHLSPQQQQQLMRLCSNIIRGRAGKGRLLGGGNGGPGRQHFGPGKGNGRGPGRFGQGRGRGQGRRRRHRRRLARNIEFTPEQIQLFEQLDHKFEAESTKLAKTVSDEHEQLALLLETQSTNDNDILEQLEKLLESRARLERRTSRHVLLIRPHLSPEQQKILVGLCANCGRGWNRE
jgi:Spy/CpxP family protein refolding chaperone